MDKRKDQRLHVKMYAKLTCGRATSWGILSDVSENGLFLKSIRDFALDAAIDIEIVMQDNRTSILKGIVKRRIELPEEHRKYGLGIELIKKDCRFMDLLVSLADYSKNKAVELVG